MYFLARGHGGLCLSLSRIAISPRDAVIVELTELLAVVAGAFMLRGHDWARWLALAWMAFHVAVSFADPIRKLGMHVLIFAVIAWILLRPDAGRYFRGSGTQTT